MKVSVLLSGFCVVKLSAGYASPAPDLPTQPLPSVAPPPLSARRGPEITVFETTASQATTSVPSDIEVTPITEAGASYTTVVIYVPEGIDGYPPGTLTVPLPSLSTTVVVQVPLDSDGIPDGTLSLVIPVPPMTSASTSTLAQPTCVPDTCYSALIGAGASATSFCSSFLGTTTLTSLTTVTSVATAFQTSLETSIDTDFTTLDQTSLSTLIVDVPATSEIVILSTLTEIVSTAIETATAQKRDVGTTLLKKRKVCPPKSSTISSSSSFSPTTTSSTSVNPTNVCTASSQISSVCSCLGVTGAQTTILQTSTFESTITEVSTITNYLTATEVLTSIDSEVTTLFSTDLSIGTSVSTIIDELTLTATTTVSAPLVSSTSFILMVSSLGDTHSGQYLTLDYATSDSHHNYLTYTPKIADAVQLQIMNGELFFAFDPTHETSAYTASYIPSGGTLLIFANFEYAYTQDYNLQSFSMSGPGPYYVGSSGTLSPKGESVSFCDCTSDVELCYGTPTCGSAYTLSYIYV